MNFKITKYLKSFKLLMNRISSIVFFIIGLLILSICMPLMMSNFTSYSGIYNTYYVNHVNTHNDYYIYDSNVLEYFDNELTYSNANYPRYVSFRVGEDCNITSISVYGMGQTNKWFDCYIFNASWNATYSRFVPNNHGIYNQYYAQSNYSIKTLNFNQIYLNFSNILINLDNTKTENNTWFVSIYNSTQSANTFAWRYHNDYANNTSCYYLDNDFLSETNMDFCMNLTTTYSTNTIVAINEKNESVGKLINTILPIAILIGIFSAIIVSAKKKDNLS